MASLHSKWSKRVTLPVGKRWDSGGSVAECLVWNKSSPKPREEPRSYTHKQTKQTIRFESRLDDHATMRIDGDLKVMTPQPPSNVNTGRVSRQSRQGAYTKRNMESSGKRSVTPGYRGPVHGYLDSPEPVLDTTRLEIDTRRTEFKIQDELEPREELPYNDTQRTVRVATQRTGRNGLDTDRLNTLKHISDMTPAELDRYEQRVLTKYQELNDKLFEEKYGSIYNDKVVRDRESIYGFDRLKKNGSSLRDRPPTPPRSVSVRQRPASPGYRYKTNKHGYKPAATAATIPTSYQEQVLQNAVNAHVKEAWNKTQTPVPQDSMPGYMIGKPPAHPQSRQRDNYSRNNNNRNASRTTDRYTSKTPNDLMVSKLNSTSPYFNNYTDDMKKSMTVDEILQATKTGNVMGEGYRSRPASAHVAWDDRVVDSSNRKMYPHNKHFNDWRDTTEDLGKENYRRMGRYSAASGDGKGKVSVELDCPDGGDMNVNLSVTSRPAPALLR